jgi:hypothetical protein
MRRYYIVSRILLILPIIDFAVAAPVLVQEKRQTDVGVVHKPEDAIIILGKRGDNLNNALFIYEDYIDKLLAAHPSSRLPPSEPHHGWTNVEQPLPSIAEEEDPMPSTESDHDWTEVHTSSTMSDADHDWVEPPALWNPGPSRESGPESTKIHAPLSSPVFPTWFHPDHADDGLLGSHASLPNSGPSNTRPLTELDSGHRLVVEEPPPRPASPTKFNADQVRGGVSAIRPSP